MRKTSSSGTTAERYARLKGKHVVIYYRDMRETDRTLHGILTDIDGDILWLQNGQWQGALDCAVSKVTLVSTVDGWNVRQVETKDSFFGKLFRR